MSGRRPEEDLSEAATQMLEVLSALESEPSFVTEPAQLWTLLPLVYERLRALAVAHLAGERTGHTLQATALVHEAFLRLVDRHAPFSDSAHFLAAASQAMRRILVDHARGRGRRKRGAGAARLDLTSVELPDGGRDFDLVELDDALQRLASEDEREARVVEMRFFAGMDEAEIAGVLGVSDRSVRRYWLHAKAWLARELFDRESEGEAGR
jgi:RNA polymerase sigma-70 factor (ECF subfamily)